MRTGVAWLLFALPFLAVGQSDDPRFQKVVPLDARYMPLAEFGSAVEKASGVKITVAKAIAERKVAVFSDDRPLGEVMARLADTLFLQWAEEKDGIRLQLHPDAEGEERKLEREEQDLAFRHLRRGIHELAEHGRKPLAQYRATQQAARAEYDESLRDTSEKGKARTAELAANLNRRFPFGDAREPWDRGYALSQIGGIQIEALLNGQTFFASTNPSPSVARLSPDAAQLFHQHGSRTIDLPSKQALPALLPEGSILRIRPHGTPGVFIYSSPEIRHRRLSDRSLAPDTLFSGWNFAVLAGEAFSLEQNIPIKPLDPSKPGTAGGPPP